MIVYDAIDDGMTVEQVIERLKPKSKMQTVDEFYSTANRQTVKNWVQKLIKEGKIMYEGGKLFRCF